MALTSSQVNLDASTEVTTDPFSLDRAVSGFSVQVIVTGAPNGTLALEGRNSSATQWMGIGGTTYSQTITTVGSQMLEYADANFQEARLHWTPNGGSTGKIAVYWYARESRL